MDHPIDNSGQRVGSQGANKPLGRSVLCSSAPMAVNGQGRCRHRSSWSSRSRSSRTRQRTSWAIGGFPGIILWCCLSFTCIFWVLLFLGCGLWCFIGVLVLVCFQHEDAYCAASVAGVSVFWSFPSHTGGSPITMLLVLS